jgi:hypothetical protein
LDVAYVWLNNAVADRVDDNLGTDDGEKLLVVIGPADADFDWSSFLPTNFFGGLLRSKSLRIRVVYRDDFIILLQSGDGRRAVINGASNDKAMFFL